jgi:NitT/TauT family transport system ATP-binding protein
MGEPIISITNLKKVFLQKLESLLALENVSLEIFSGEFVCILGPSGCGKSTLLNVLSRLESWDEGLVKVGGVALEESKLRIGYVFQEPRLLPWLTIERNLLFALDCMGVGGKAASDRIRASLDMVGLTGFEKYHPYQLSGGMQQRASISRALCIDPDILLMDEPFSGLDEITARTLRTELMKIWQETGKTVVFVTHNWYEASYLADRILIMKKRPGSIIKEVRVLIDRPRSYEDPRVFEFSSNLVSDFLRIIDAEVR